VTLFDLVTRESVGELSVGVGPCAVAVLPERGEAFVVNSLAGTLARIDLDAREVVGEVAVGRAPVGIAPSSTGERLYVANRGGGDLSVVDVYQSAEWQRISVGNAPGGVAIDARGGRLLVANAGSATIHVLDDLPVGRPPAGLPNGAHPLVGKKLPPFSLLDLATGKHRSSLEWADRKFILNFFASW
jgi:YVTN family beta-propeller protein